MFQFLPIFALLVSNILADQYSAKNTLEQGNLQFNDQRNRPYQDVIKLNAETRLFNRFHEDEGFGWTTELWKCGFVKNCIGGHHCCDHLSATCCPTHTTCCRKGLFAVYCCSLHLNVPLMKAIPAVAMELTQL